MGKKAIPTLSLVTSGSVRRLHGLNYLISTGTAAFATRNATAKVITTPAKHPLYQMFICFCSTLDLHTRQVFMFVKSQAYYTAYLKLFHSYMYKSTWHSLTDNIQTQTRSISYILKPKSGAEDSAKASVMVLSSIS